MKIRNGFVSNSSSSSFVMAYKKCDKCDRHDIDFGIIFHELGHKNNFSETKLVATGLNTIAKILKDYYEEELIDCKDTEKRSEEFIRYMSNVSRISNFADHELFLVNVEYSDDVLFEALMKVANVKKVLSYF